MFFFPSAQASVKSVEQWEQQKPAMMQALAFTKLDCIKATTVHSVAVERSSKMIQLSQHFSGV